MKYETRKQLKNKLEALKRENMFLHRGIDSRDQAHDIACEQRDRAMALQQELVFLLLYMQAVEEVIKDDFSSNAKTIKRAINKFKMELTDGFAANHLILQLNNNDENNDIAI